MAQTERGVPLSTLCPKYLHANSTSHVWPFSAIAELIDNACDPDASAKQFWIDKTRIKGQECLSFMDNGNGVNYEMMHKMLSFGYSDKTAVKGIKPIGIYGNGFKSGSMRLGQDVIVFSKSKDALCVGMLSQSYLKEIKAEQIVVPIVSLNKRHQAKPFNKLSLTSDSLSVREQHKASLQDILHYSPFREKEELLNELNAINTINTNSSTGTRVIIWNLRRTSTGVNEFDFTKDRYDIQILSDVFEEINQQYKCPERLMPSTPACTYSLRAYCSILYLKPRMQIIICGQKVKTQLISKSLAHVAKDQYKPSFLKKPTNITFGYNTKSKDQYGIMMYHKNRLIKAYERVGCQQKANFKGVGVIGVIECDFLEPTHNKQDFDNTDKYRKTINSLGIKLEEYWKQMCFKRKNDDPNTNIPMEDITKRPDQNWVQCDDCLKWRKLPDGIDGDLLPDKWSCHLNPDPQFRNCQVAEELEDSDDEQPYQKTYKQQEREDKRKQQSLEEERERKEKERIDKLARENKTLKQQLNQKTTARSPSTPDTPRNRVRVKRSQGGTARAETSPARPSTLSQAACSPSSSSTPKIIDVRSLLTTPSRMKRTQPMTPESVSKRPRANGFHGSTSDTTAQQSPLSSTSTPIILHEEDCDDDITDDDEIVILEAVSTPLPKKPGFNLTKVKTERQPSDLNVGPPMECSGNAAVDTASEANAPGTSSTETAVVRMGPSPPPPLKQTSTTQTEVPKIKEEEEMRTEQSVPQVNGNEMRLDVATNTNTVEQRVIKLESAGDTGTHRGANGFNNGVASSYQPDTEEVAGPSHPDPEDTKVPGFDYWGAQKQQDELLELMETTAQERDSLKEQVKLLTQESSLVTVKKECTHQGSQTEAAKGEEDYKRLYGQARQRADELSEQVDCLAQELDQSNKERDELLLQVECLKDEMANMFTQFKQNQQRADTEGGSNTRPTACNPSANIDQEEAGGTGMASISAASSLVQLRHNVGRLLLNYVPALALDQVNYECDVIDEILEQFLSGDHLGSHVGD
ncbi:LOW QUALITY PROTEIN: MORC family CW-type zinc finger protein 3a [Polymixia lowei]